MATDKAKVRYVLLQSTILQYPTLGTEIVVEGAEVVIVKLLRRVVQKVVLPLPQSLA